MRGGEVRKDPRQVGCVGSSGEIVGGSGEMKGTGRSSVGSVGGVKTGGGKGFFSKRGKGGEHEGETLKRFINTVWDSEGLGKRSGEGREKSRHFCVQKRERR